MSGNFLGVPLVFLGMALLVNATWLRGKVETRDVGIFNLLAGILAFMASIYFAWAQSNFALSCGLMLFSITFLWVGLNAVRGAVDQRALGTYCLLVALITIPYAIKAYQGGDFGWTVEWITFGALWYVFFELLGKQNVRVTGVTVALTYFVGLEVVVTGWAYLYGYWPFGHWWPLHAV